MVAFLIIFVFNIYWLYQDGFMAYIERYNHYEVGAWAIFFWLYALFGIACLTHYLLT